MRNDNDRTEQIPTPDDASNSRYSRQVLFAGIGKAGQRRLRESSVLVCGCGALGTVLAESLARAGVGHLRIVDRDFVEVSNLQRQVLFTERDAAERLPKAVAAARTLREINSDITIEPIVADIDHNNVLTFTERTHLILDGTDNFEVRFLLNDASLETGIVWIYGGCIGSHGQTMTVFPGESACLRCLIDGVPDPGTTETCDTAGVLGPAVNVVASLQVADALKVLTGQRDLVRSTLTIVDVWTPSLREMSVEDLRSRSNCPACVGGERTWLSGRQGAQTTVLCGRNAVQVAPQHKAQLSLEALAEKLQGAVRVDQNPYLLRFVLQDPDYDVTVFRDGRAIIKGTDDAGVAKTVYARYIGS